VAMIGTKEVQPCGSMWLRPFRRVEVRFGAPLDVRRFAGATDDPLALRALTDELMFEIRRLSGQEYVDHYAKRHGVVGSPATASVRSLAPVEASSMLSTGAQFAAPVDGDSSAVVAEPSGSGNSDHVVERYMDPSPQAHPAA